MTSLISTKMIHQILITDTGKIPATTNSVLSFNIDSVHEVYRNTPYKLWSGDEIGSFIEAEFDAETLNAYFSLAPFSFKSDLARYCLLYVLGGLYIDLGVRILRQWHIPVGKGIGAFRDISFISSSWTALQTGLIWSEPGRPELKVAIETIIRHVRDRYYGSNPLYPTGPVVLGRSFIRAMVAKGKDERADDQEVGQCRAITSDADIINLCYVTKEGAFVAMRAKGRDGDLTSLGLKGTNNYNTIWNSRTAYNENVKRWTFKDPLVRRSHDTQLCDQALIINSGLSHNAVFGPYVDLPVGAYELELFLYSDDDDTFVRVDITSDCGEYVLQTFEIELGRSRGKSHKNDLIIWKSASAVEICISNKSNSEINLIGYTIASTDSTLWDFRSDRINYRDININSLAAKIEINGKEPLIYGPYIDVQAGKYELHAYFTGPIKLNRPQLEITKNFGTEMIASSDWEIYSAETCGHLAVKFDLDQDAQKVEFRLSCSPDSVMGFSGYVLCKLD